MELPRYVCHKEVWALKIAAIEVHEDLSATISPEDTRYFTFKAKEGWASRFKPEGEDPGYYVIYKDGFVSWSPTKAFEEGYSLKK